RGGGCWGASAFPGRGRVRTAYSPRARPSGSASSRARPICWRRVSIIVLPTKWIFSSATPPFRKFSTATMSVVNRKIRNGIGAEAVDLFRHGHVARAQASFDVSDADAEFLGGEGARNRRVHVSHDDHPIRTMFQAGRLKRHHDARGLLGMRARPNLQINVGFGNA